MEDDKVHEKLDKIIDQQINLIKEIGELKVEQAEIKVDVKYHIKRTDIAEENIEILRKEVQPLFKFRDYVMGALKLIGLLGVLATIVMATVEAIQFILRLHH